jgi:hypothetical protein
MVLGKGGVINEAIGLSGSPYYGRAQEISYKIE